MSQKILIVDDEAGSRQFFEYVLIKNGYESIIAQDGIEALEILDNHWVDLVLSDVAMPRLNGYQLYKRVREKGGEDVRFAILPFIFVTARGMDSDVRYAKALGVDDYLIKPIMVDDLLAVVEGKIQASQTILAALDNQPEQVIFKINNHVLRLDFEHHRSWCDDTELILSPREELALECLGKTPNQIACAVKLVSITHGIDTDKMDAGRLLRPLIRDLRNKLKQGFGDIECIQNVRGRGYMLASF